VYIGTFPFYAYPWGAGFLKDLLCQFSDTGIATVSKNCTTRFILAVSSGMIQQSRGTCTIVNYYSGALYLEIMKAVLGLEDGDYVIGEGFGVKGECSGELVFNTLMSGYMEALSDPSYYGQIHRICRAIMSRH
jgi:Carbamoyl-phosphate synthase small chain, CPSase domain